MSSSATEWRDALVHLFALASKLEGEGQYNLAKLARAAADSISRQAAFRASVPSSTDELAADIKRTADDLAHLGVSEDLRSALKQGAGVMAAGQLPLFKLIPHPYVCRTCGELLLHEPAEKCPTCDAWPGTYQRFMPNYWFDALEPPAALARLRQTPLDVAKLLEGLSEAQMNQPPPEGGWAIGDVLTHLRDAQGVLHFRLGLFQKEENPLLEAKAVFAWATQGDNRPASAFDAFSSYRASRADTMRLLEQLPLAHWWRTGQHQEFGPVSLRQQVSYFASHEITHFAQIEALRRRSERNHR